MGIKDRLVAAAEHEASTHPLQTLLVAIYIVSSVAESTNQGWAYTVLSAGGIEFFRSLISLSKSGEIKIEGATIGTLAAVTTATMVTTMNQIPH